MQQSSLCLTYYVKDDRRFETRAPPMTYSGDAIWRLVSEYTDHKIEVVSSAKCAS